MLVETYEVTELMADGSLECEEEAKELIEQLGLSGQMKLANKETGTRSPYRKMTKDESFVYSRLLPVYTKISDYSDGPIPLRVLQVAAHAKDEFDELYVWHPSNADVKDPLLVGIKNVSTYEHHHYILARWGDVLDAFDKIAVKAAEIWRNEALVSCEKAINESTAMMATIKNASAQMILTGSIGKPIFYVGS